MSYGGGSGGSGRIATAADAAMNTLSNGDVLAYDAVLQKWKNVQITAPALADGSVTSAKIADATIVDGDISATAAIGQSKVSGLPAALTAKLGRPLQISTSAVIAPGTAPTFVIRS